MSVSNPNAADVGGQPNGRPRRRWTPARKLQLVLETLQPDRKLAEICRREGLSPNLVYLWRKQLLGSAEAIFGPKPRGGGDPRTEKLAADNARMKSVIAEITAENLELQKNALGLSDYGQLPAELQGEVLAVVQQTKQRSGWPVRRTLRVLEIPPGSFYRWRREPPPGAPGDPPAPRSNPGSLYELLPAERRQIVDYALAHPEVRHRELAWKMLDESVVGVSAASVYRVLREANLVCRWQPRSKRHGEARRPLPTRPDEQWQTDLRYVKVGRRNYYLLSFLDVYSRYVVHWALLRWMDGVSVAVEAAAALATLTPQERPVLEAGGAPQSVPRRGPVIQSDHGSAFVAREFAGTLAESEVGHTRIRPHTPTDNAFVERYHRTIGEQIDEHELADDVQARAVIDAILAHYNGARLHSSLSFLRPVDFYRGDPAALLAERRRKLQTARELRKQENIKLRQRRLPWAEGETSSTRKEQVSHLV